MFKSGICSIPANNMPIALTSHLVKVFEKVIRNAVVAFMDENKLFNKSQHGFRAGRLLGNFCSILENLENGANVDIIYLDFAKAFDKVDIGIALEKFKSNRISGKMLSFFEAFFKARTQSVCVNGCSSKSCPVTSGVPQGSVLVMIGDMDEGIANALLSSFADDTRLLKHIAQLIDISLLQEDLNSVYHWTDQCNSLLNSTKFECMRYSMNVEIEESTYLTPDRSPIKCMDYVKDLGIIMSNDCTFNCHLEKVVSSAKVSSSWILRTFQTRE